MINHAIKYRTMKTKILFILLLGILFFSRGEMQAQVSFTPSTLSWTAGEASTKYATVHVTGGGSWQCDSTVYSNHFSISSRFGSNGGSIAVTPLSANTGDFAIEGGIDVSGGGGYGILYLVHDAPVPTLEVSPSALSWTFDGTAQKTIYVTAASGTWDYILSGSGFSCTKSGSTLLVQPTGWNNGDSPHTAAIAFSSAGETSTVSLIQAANPYVSGVTDTNYVQKTTFTSAGGTTYYRDVTYYDGLGYEVQGIAVGGSPSGKSIVNQTVYDAMRRPDAMVYLPYTRGDAGASLTPEAVSLDVQQSFYGNLCGDAHPWSQKEYGSSSAGRVMSVRREGDAWSAADGRKTTLSYLGNTSADAVMKFSFKPAQGDSCAVAVYAPSDQYGDGVLRKVRSRDEEGAVSETFTDGAGRTVCVRNWSGADGTGTSSDTYYVYDLRDSVALVIQPEGAALLLGKPASQRNIPIFGGEGGMNADIFEDWCFAWRYDGTGNLVVEHVPGGGTKDYIYDIRNRLVLQTDSAMSETDSIAFIRTEYDDYDRVVRRSVVYTDLPVLSLRSQARNATGLPASVESVLRQECVLYEAEYYPYLAQYAFTYPNTGLDAFYPVSGVVSSSDLETANVKGLLKSETLYPAANADGSALASGGLTISRRYHYDRYGRIIQIVENGSDGSLFRTSTKYDFVGNVLAISETHTLANEDGGNTVLTLNSYDGRGRLLGSSTTLNECTTGSVAYSYDELGRITSKTVSSGGETGTQTFNYDVHGWQTNTVAGKDGVQLFGETLRYGSGQKEPGSARFDGNIAEAAFSQTEGTALPTATYAYSYDGLKRLTDARRYDGNANTASPTFTERNISYDRNGNITSLKRYGSSDLENDLEYNLSGNRISMLTDWNGYGIPTYNYVYDVMGRMTSDGRKGLQICYNLSNLPSKVEGMAGSANAGLTLSYCYLADGTKSSALTSTGAGVRYRGNFVYEVTSEGAERLQSVPWAEGRIVLEHYGETVVDSLVLDVPLVPEEDVVAIDTVVAGGFDPRVCWHVTDHLGSTREVVVLGAGLMGRSAVVESNGYLPFGTRYGKTPGTSYILTEGNSNRYRFSGKEEQRFGWDADACRPVADLGLQDFGARYYNPFTCRWTTPDPLAGKYLSLSPYNYCAGNPVRYVDPDGCFVHYFVGAAVAMTLDYSLQVTSNVLKGENLSNALRNIDGRSVLISGAAGALGVGALSKVKQFGETVKMGRTAMAAIKAGTEASVSAAESTVQQLASDGQVSVSKVAGDAAIGAFSSGRGQLKKQSVQNSNGANLLRKDLDHVKRVAGNNPKPSRQAKISTLQNKIETYGDGREAAVRNLSEYTIKLFKNSITEERDESKIDF